MSDPIEVLANRLNLSLEAIAEAIRIAADQGAGQAIEHLADYLNNCDAVEEGDAEVYERWMARHGAEKAAREGLLDALEALRTDPVVSGLSAHIRDEALHAGRPNPISLADAALGIARRSS